MRTKQVFHIMSVLALGLTLASCGKDNKAGNNVSNGTFSAPFQTGSNGSVVQNQYCQGGQATSYSFSFVSYNSAQVQFSQQNLVSGQQITGQTSNVYYGRDYGTGDQVAVQKVSNGQQAQYNVQMSICPLLNGGQLQIQQITQGWFQLGVQTGSGVAGTVYFAGQVNGYPFQEYSQFAPAQ